MAKSLASKTGEVTYLKKGDKGARLRLRDWAVGQSLLRGSAGEEWYDVSLYKDKLYLCIKSHTATTANNPQTSVAGNLGFWEVAQDWAFVATKLLLADRINAMDIDTDSLVVRNLMSSYTGARVEISGSEMRVFGDAAMNIRFGVNTDGMAVLEYYDNDGRKLYDLGPGGITTIPVTVESWNTYYNRFLGTNITTILGAGAYKSVTYQSTDVMYLYNSKIVAGVVDDPVNDNRTFVRKDKTSAKIADGWYCKSPSKQGELQMNLESQIVDENGDRIYPYGIHTSNEAVYARRPVYFAVLSRYSAGLFVESINAYWNGR